jgi:hypothetical protein
MASLKKSLMKQGMKLMTDPRVMKLMQDERVMKAVMAAMSMPGKVQSFTQEQTEKIAKAMALATEDEVKDLKRTVRRLEEEIARIQRDKK